MGGTAGSSSGPWQRWHWEQQQQQEKKDQDWKIERERQGLCVVSVSYKGPATQAICALCVVSQSEPWIGFQLPTWEQNGRHIQCVRECWDSHQAGHVPEASFV